jgi:hypothetical protein
MSHRYIESHGVKLDIEVQPPELQDAALSILPPDWRPFSGFPEHGHFVIVRTPAAAYDVFAEGAAVATDLTPEVAVRVLDSQIRSRIARLAHDRIFVHAGVVAVDGRAVVIPGRSFSGKSSLVAALVSRGAAYYSDEFAVLDGEGRVHPYAKPLSIRQPDERYGDRVTVDALGAQRGEDPIDVACIVVTEFKDGAEWRPDRRPVRVGALALLTNTVPAQERPREAVRATARAAAGTIVFEGPRGDALQTAEALLRQWAGERSPNSAEPASP